jgi:ferredoxin
MPPNPSHLIRCRSGFPGRPDKEVAVAEDQTLFEALRAAEHPIASSCDGAAVCGRCVVSVLEGAQSLSEMDAVERAVLRNEGAQEHQRLACQSFALGPGIVVSTDYW